MQQTTNYKLNQIERTDKIKDSIDALGSNVVEIDRLIKETVDHIGTVEENVNKDIETIGTTLEDMGKELDEIEENIEKIDDRLIKTEEKIDRAETILPTQTASGENVYIDNAVNYPVIGLIGEGKCEQVTTTGKNMYNKDTDEVGKVYSDTGNYSDSPLWTTSDWISVESSTGYCIHSKTTNTQNFFTSEFDENKIFIQRTTGEKITTNANAKYIRFSYKNDLGMYDIQIEKGTEATSYEPYTGGQASPSPNYKQEITTISEAKYKGVAENLYNYKNTKNVNDEMIVDDDGWITATYDNTSGTATKFLNYQIKRSELIKPNTSYLLVTEIKEVSGNNCVLYLSQNQPTAQYLTQVNYEFTDIKNGDVKVTKIVSQKDVSTPISMLQTFIGVRAGGSCSITFRISVLADTNITAENFVYEPYQETTLPIDLQGNKLCEVGDVANKLLIDRKGNVAIEKNIGKTILNSSEYWTVQNNVFITYIDDIKIQTWSERSIIVLSDYFVSQASDYRSNILENRIAKVIDPGNPRQLAIKCSQFTTIDEFKAWLQENNTTVYYVLATPQIIDLGTIENPEIFKGVNNIIVETNLGNMPIEVEYVEDLQVRISKLEQAFVAQGGI